jgi:hypothetical protein
VTAEACESCRQILAEHESNSKLADILEAKHPACACEPYTVGQGSPGPVDNSETLLRIIISPRDADPASGTIFARPFEKAFGNGVSVCRELAENEHILALVREGLSRSRDREPKVLKICRAVTDAIRAIQDESGERVFCIYDQTVTRDDPCQPPIPTHAGIFGRYPPPNTDNRKKIQKDFAGKLRELFIAGEIPLTRFRNGLINIG